MGLREYIESAKKQGANEAQIRDALTKNGWAVQDIDSALRPAQDALVVPPPPAPHFGMWVAFLYIILFISLYVSATSFGGILHLVVDEKIPDKLATLGYGYYANQYLMQAYLACLIVGFPIFAGLFLFLKRQVIKQPAIKSLRARKQLVYLTLVGTFLIMLGHLIATIYGFLGGTVTARSLGHLGVTFFVAGSIFVYFLVDVWGDRRQA